MSDPVLGELPNLFISVPDLRDVNEQPVLKPSRSTSWFSPSDVAVDEGIFPTLQQIPLVVGSMSPGSPALSRRLSVAGSPGLSVSQKYKLPLAPQTALRTATLLRRASVDLESPLHSPQLSLMLSGSPRAGAPGAPISPEPLLTPTRPSSTAPSRHLSPRSSGGPKVTSTSPALPTRTLPGSRGHARRTSVAAEWVRAGDPSSGRQGPAVGVGPYDGSSAKASHRRVSSAFAFASQPISRDTDFVIASRTPDHQSRPLVTASVSPTATVSVAPLEVSCADSAHDNATTPSPQLLPSLAPAIAAPAPVFSPAPILCEGNSPHRPPFRPPSRPPSRPHSARAGAAADHADGRLSSTSPLARQRPPTAPAATPVSATAVVVPTMTAVLGVTAKDSETVELEVKAGTSTAAEVEAQAGSVLKPPVVCPVSVGEESHPHDLASVPPPIPDHIDATQPLHHVDVRLPSVHLSLCLSPASAHSASSRSPSSSPLAQPPAHPVVSPASSGILSPPLLSPSTAAEQPAAGLYQQLVTVGEWRGERVTMSHDHYVDLFRAYSQQMDALRQSACDAPTAARPIRALGPSTTPTREDALGRWSSFASARPLPLAPSGAGSGAITLSSWPNTNSDTSIPTSTSLSASIPDLKSLVIQDRSSLTLPLLGFALGIPAHAPLSADLTADGSAGADSSSTQALGPAPPGLLSALRVDPPATETTPVPAVPLTTEPPLPIRTLPTASVQAPLGTSLSVTLPSPPASEEGDALALLPSIREKQPTPHHFYFRASLRCADDMHVAPATGPDAGTARVVSRTDAKAAGLAGEPLVLPDGDLTVKTMHQLVRAQGANESGGHVGEDAEGAAAYAAISTAEALERPFFSADEHYAPVLAHADMRTARAPSATAHPDHAPEFPGDISQAASPFHTGSPASSSPTAALHHTAPSSARSALSLLSPLPTPTVACGEAECRVVSLDTCAAQPAHDTETSSSTHTLTSVPSTKDSQRPVTTTTVKPRAGALDSPSTTPPRPSTGASTATHPRTRPGTSSSSVDLNAGTPSRPGSSVSAAAAMRFLRLPTVYASPFSPVNANGAGFFAEERSEGRGSPRSRPGSQSSATRTIASAPVAGTEVRHHLVGPNAPAFLTSTGPGHLLLPPTPSGAQPALARSNTERDNFTPWTELSPEEVQYVSAMSQLWEQMVQEADLSHAVEAAVSLKHGAGTGSLAHMREKEKAHAQQALQERERRLDELIHNVKDINAAVVAACKKNDAAFLEAWASRQASAHSILSVFNGSDKAGSTPLFHCAWVGSTDCVRVLLTYGAEANHVNLRNNTALHLACERGHQSLIYEMLKHGAVVTHVNGQNRVCYDPPLCSEETKQFVFDCLVRLGRPIPKEVVRKPPNPRYKGMRRNFVQIGKQKQKVRQAGRDMDDVFFRTGRVVVFGMDEQHKRRLQSLTAQQQQDRRKQLDMPQLLSALKARGGQVWSWVEANVVKDSRVLAQLGPYLGLLVEHGGSPAALRQALVESKLKPSLRTLQTLMRVQRNLMRALADHNLACYREQANERRETSRSALYEQLFELRRNPTVSRLHQGQPTHTPAHANNPDTHSTTRPLTARVGSSKPVVDAPVHTVNLPMPSVRDVVPVIRKSTFRKSTSRFSHVSDQLSTQAKPVSPPPTRPIAPNSALPASRVVKAAPPPHPSTALAYAHTASSHARTMQSRDPLDADVAPAASTRSQSPHMPTAAFHSDSRALLRTASSLLRASGETRGPHVTSSLPHSARTHHASSHTTADRVQATSKDAAAQGANNTVSSPTVPRLALPSLAVPSLSQAHMAKKTARKHVFASSARLPSDLALMGRRALSVTTKALLSQQKLQHGTTSTAAAFDPQRLGERKDLILRSTFDTGVDEPRHRAAATRLPEASGCLSQGFGSRVASASAPLTTSAPASMPSSAYAARPGSQAHILVALPDTHAARAASARGAPPGNSASADEHTLVSSDVDDATVIRNITARVIPAPPPTPPVSVSRVRVSVSRKMGLGAAYSEALAEAGGFDKSGILFSLARNPSPTRAEVAQAYPVSLRGAALEEHLPFGSDTSLSSIRLPSANATSLSLTSTLAGSGTGTGMSSLFSDVLASAPRGASGGIDRASTARAGAGAQAPAQGDVLRAHDRAGVVTRLAKKEASTNRGKAFLARMQVLEEEREAKVGKRGRTQARKELPAWMQEREPEEEEVPVAQVVSLTQLQAARQNVHVVNYRQQDAPRSRNENRRPREQAQGSTSISMGVSVSGPSACADAQLNPSRPVTAVDDAATSSGASSFINPPLSRSLESWMATLQQTNNEYTHKATQALNKDLRAHVPSTRTLTRMHLIAKLYSRGTTPSLPPHVAPVPPPRGGLMAPATLGPPRATRGAAGVSTDVAASHPHRPAAAEHPERSGGDTLPQLPSLSTTSVGGSTLPPSRGHTRHLATSSRAGTASVTAAPAPEVTYARTSSRRIPSLATMTVDVTTLDTLEATLSTNSGNLETGKFYVQKPTFPGTQRRDASSPSANNKRTLRQGGLSNTMPLSGSSTLVPSRTRPHGVPFPPLPATASGSAALAIAANNTGLNTATSGASSGSMHMFPDPALGIVPHGGGSFGGLMQAAMLVRHGLKQQALSVVEEETMPIIAPAQVSYWVNNEWEQSKKDQLKYLTSF